MFFRLLSTDCPSGALYICYCCGSPCLIFRLMNSVLAIIGFPCVILWLAIQELTVFPEHTTSPLYCCGSSCLILRFMFEQSFVDRCLSLCLFCRLAIQELTVFPEHISSPLYCCGSSCSILRFMYSILLPIVYVCHCLSAVYGIVCLY